MPTAAWIADWIEGLGPDTGHFVSGGAAADIAAQVRQKLTEEDTRQAAIRAPQSLLLAGAVESAIGFAEVALPAGPRERWATYYAPRLREAAAPVSSAEPWISTKDRLPAARNGSEQTDEVMVAYRTSAGYIVTTARAAWFGKVIAWRGIPDPTHWMPLPEPPK